MVLKKDKNKICRLNRPLYGLKQAPLCWNKKLTKTLEKYGLIQLQTEQCVFKNKSGSLYLGIYVDDGIIIGKNDQEIDKVLIELSNNFEITVVNDPKTFVGLEIDKTEDGIFLHQTSYAERVLDRFNMSDTKGADTPMISGQDKLKHNAKDLKFPYRQAVGSLLYLSNKTRPDLAYAVGFESRNLENPSHEDIVRVKRTLKYLQATKSYGIHYAYNGKIGIDAYSDSDFAGCLATRRSTTGYVLFIDRTPVAWCSRRQDIVALSTAEAEYIAAAECGKEIIYVKSLINEMLNIDVDAVLHVDNQSAINMLKSGQIRKRSKHIDVRFHFISEKIRNKIFSIKYCPTQNQVADIFTKPLKRNLFERHTDKLMFKNETK